MTYKIYDTSGQECEVHWQVDLNEMLATKQWFLEKPKVAKLPPKPKKQNKKGDKKDD